jgi:hypothetical protein
LTVIGCKARSYNTAGVKDSWDAGQDNNPIFFENQGNIEYNFDTLKRMSSGSLDAQPWSDTYWPNSEGGITVRWRYEEGAQRYGHKTPYTPKQIDAMSYNQLNMLSPAEKFDIVTGGYRKGWPMWQREASLTTSCPITLGVNSSQLPVRSAPGGIGHGDWEGKCHAWTPAALHFPEPGTVDVSAVKGNGEKFQVHFGSSDIKALLIVGYDMWLNQYPNYARVGRRCGNDGSNIGAGSTSPCLDTNAGTFFVLATNFIQPGKKGFVIDVVPSSQVWNQPVWKYTHSIREGSCPITIPNPAKPGEKVAHVQTKLYWISEKDAAENPHGTGNNVHTTDYEYCVEIDPATNKVIGGAWIGEERPDFIWMSAKPNFSAEHKDTRSGLTFDLSMIDKIHGWSRSGQSKPQPSTQPTPPPTPTPPPRWGECSRIKVTGGANGFYWAYSNPKPRASDAVGTLDPGSVHNVLSKSGTYFAIDGSKFNRKEVYFHQNGVECL